MKFEDLTWLWNCRSFMARDTIGIDFDEAALLYRTVHDTIQYPRCFCLEIGRAKGGSTILMVAANDGSVVDSIDINSKYDSALLSLLSQFHLDGRTHLIVGDSKIVGKVIENHYDVVFIDGDHTYEGVMADYQRWKMSVKPGGHLLFHDAAGKLQPKGSPITSPHKGVIQLVKEMEIEDKDQFEWITTAGSMVKFRRTNKLW